MRNKTNKENTRQRKQSHAQDNIYVVRQGFHYKIRRYNSALEHSQKTQIPITPQHSLTETIRIEAEIGRAHV